MANELAGTTVAFLVANEGVEQVELTEPWAAVRDAGGTPRLEADVVRGRTLTSWPSLQTDVRNAGGTWVDREVVVCESGPNVLVSSRKPDDLKAFCQELVDRFAKA